MKLTLLPWQALPDGVHVEATAATMDELRTHRASRLFEESLTDKAGRLTATQTAFSQAVSAYMANVPDTDPAAIGRIAFASLASATPPTQPAPQLRAPDFEAQIQRHHDGQVKRDELTRLKARDEPVPVADVPKADRGNCVKRTALINRNCRRWPSIERDLKDASTNGLSAEAKANKATFWWEGDALKWAEARDKLEAQTGSVSLASVVHRMRG